MSVEATVEELFTLVELIKGKVGTFEKSQAVKSVQTPQTWNLDELNCEKEQLDMCAEQMKRIKDLVKTCSFEISSMRKTNAVMIKYCGKDVLQIIKSIETNAKPAGPKGYGSIGYHESSSSSESS